MTLVAYPFEGQTVGEDQFSQVLRLFGHDGVDGHPGDTSLKVSVVDSTHVSVGTGSALVQGFGCLITGSAESVTVTVNSNATQDRLDRIVLRLNRTANTLAPFHIAGTPSATPQLPALTRTSTIYDMPLASYTRPRNSGAITGLADGRDFLGDPAPMTSTNRHSNPHRGMLGYETDTGRQVRWTGSAWEVVFDPAAAFLTDSGWLDLNLTGSGRVATVSDLKGRKVGNVVEIRGAVRRVESGAHTSPDYSIIQGLPSSLQPLTYDRFFNCYIDGGHAGKITVYNSTPRTDNRHGGVYLVGYETFATNAVLWFSLMWTR